MVAPRFSVRMVCGKGPSPGMTRGVEQSSPGSYAVTSMSRSPFCRWRRWRWRRPESALPPRRCGPESRSARPHRPRLRCSAHSSESSQRSSRASPSGSAASAVKDTVSPMTATFGSVEDHGWRFTHRFGEAELPDPSAVGRHHDARPVTGDPQIVDRGRRQTITDGEPTQARHRMSDRDRHRCRRRRDPGPGGAN